MSTQTGLVTVEEFLKLAPPREGHYELHHGEVVLMPPPKWGHCRTQRRIEIMLRRLAGSKGEIMVEMPFQATPEHEMWLADVGFVRKERDDAVGDDEYLSGAPDLVVEVLSPSNTMQEINDKMVTCLENGCSSFWVVDSKRPRVSVTEGNVTRHYGIDDSFECDVIGALVRVREIFE